MRLLGCDRTRAAILATFGLLVAGTACNSDPTTVLVPPLEAVVASGDSQYGTPGQTLVDPLHVVVITSTSQLPRAGTNVFWEVEAGDADVLGIGSSVTDSTGSARATVRLGATTGEVLVRARVSVENQERASATFRLFTVDRPVLDDVDPVAATPGETVTLTGENFSPDPDQNVVLFSGVRGRVTSATATQLSVTVPECLPARPVGVQVQLGVVASASRTLTVGAGGEVRPLQVGEPLDATDREGYTCFTVPGDGTARYLVVLQSASTVGAASHPFQLTSLAAATPFASASAFVPGPATSPTLDALASRRPSAVRRGDPQALWDERLREIERELTKDRLPMPASEGPGARASAPAAVPALNEERSFQVWDGSGSFTRVNAVAEYVGARAAFFVDETAPAGGYTQADLAAFSDEFDDLIHPEVTAGFGGVSDLDDNDRIVILLSPEVNGLTPRGASGFIGGFFFGIDLLPGQTGSNSGEVFYALVPDPNGIHSDPRPKDDLAEITPAILAHEFQHMVNFNERVLVRGAEANEAVWLSEGMAQYAEELVARAYDDLGDSDGAARFRDGTQDRSRRYLAGTDTVSLLISQGAGSLAERGAGFLYVMYLADRFGADLTGRMTRTTNTGGANVEAETGTQWALTLSDWWSAIYLDGPGPESGPTVYPTVDLRAFLGDPFPLLPSGPGSGDVVLSGLLRSAAAGYYIVRPETGGSSTFRLGGAAGGTSTLQAALGMRIIRIQ